MFFQVKENEIVLNFIFIFIHNQILIFRIKTFKLKK